MRKMQILTIAAAITLAACGEETTVETATDSTGSDTPAALAFAEDFAEMTDYAFWDDLHSPLTAEQFSPSAVEAEMARAMLADFNSLGQRWNQEGFAIERGLDQTTDVTAFTSYTALAVHPNADDDSRTNKRTGVRVTYEITHSSGAHVNGVPVDPGDVNSCFNWDSCPEGLNRDDISFDPISTFARVDEPVACFESGVDATGTTIWEC